MKKEIESNKYLGIWMDHSVANLIDIESGDKMTKKQQFAFVKNYFPN